MRFWRKSNTNDEKLTPLESSLDFLNTLYESLHKIRFGFANLSLRHIIFLVVTYVIHDFINFNCSYLYLYFLFLLSIFLFQVISSRAMRCCFCLCVCLSFILIFVPP